ncbi:hypothetical protein LY76DRAFT_378505 [Colletotrichum caudatum]|nr:hypothetical protein LY76DRAFT_378505 [Colletotrichum caudatum]
MEGSLEATDWKSLEEETVSDRPRAKYEMLLTAYRLKSMGFWLPVTDMRTSLCQPDLILFVIVAVSVGPSPSLAASHQPSSKHTQEPRPCSQEIRAPRSKSVSQSLDAMQFFIKPCAPPCLPALAGWLPAGCHAVISRTSALGRSLALCLVGASSSHFLWRRAGGNGSRIRRCCSRGIVD